METENEDLENRIKANQVFYGLFTALFAAGSIASAISTQYEPDHKVMLYSMSAYSAILSAGTLFWWYKATRP
jgi:hypothetical protein